METRYTLKTGLQAIHEMDRVRLCDMIEEYARAYSLNDLRDCWEEVRETLLALKWLEEQIEKMK